VLFSIDKRLLSTYLTEYANVDDKQLLWKLIKMEIRSETIRYSKGKSKELKKTRKCYSKENRKIRLQNL